MEGPYSARFPSSSIGEKSRRAPTAPDITGGPPAFTARGVPFESVAPQANTNGVIISLDPRPDEAAAIACPGGEPTTRMHVTLGYFGDTSELDDTYRAGLEAAVRLAATGCHPLTGEVAGMGRFGADPPVGLDERPTLALVDAPGLFELRGAVLDACTTAGCAPSGEHDFTPHITILYGDPPEGHDPAGVPLHFDKLTLRWGEEVMDVTLTGAVLEGESPERMAVRERIAADIESAGSLGSEGACGRVADAVRGYDVDGLRTWAMHAPEVGSVLADLSITALGRLAAADLLPLPAVRQPDVWSIESEGVVFSTANGVGFDVVETPAAAGDTPTEAADYDWQGVLIVEGIPSGDRRMVAEGALTWRELPLPLMLQTVNEDGHRGSMICGSILTIERAGRNIIGRGRFDSGPAGTEARRLLTERTMRGVSADIDSVATELRSPDGSPIEPTLEDLLFGGGDMLEVLVEGRLMGATMTPFPAFQEAYLEVLDSLEPALAASLGANRADVWRAHTPIVYADADLPALVASSNVTRLPLIPIDPPGDWFALRPGVPPPYRVEADGRMYGLIAEKGSCHIGFDGRCVMVPAPHDNYRTFRNKNVLTAEGAMVPTGPIYLDTVHPDLALGASDAMTWYAHTGAAVADAALYWVEPYGMVIAGAVRPTATREQIRVLRGSDVSPDWRTIDGWLEVVGVLAVNVSGFIVKGLVASGGFDAHGHVIRGIEPGRLAARVDAATGEVTALVAAGMVRRKATRVESLERQVQELAAAVRPLRLDRVRATFALDDDEDPVLVAQAVDAVLDDASEALDAGDIAQADDLVTAAEVLADQLIELLGGVDADDVEPVGVASTLVQTFRRRLRVARVMEQFADRSPLATLTFDVEVDGDHVGVATVPLSACSCGGACSCATLEPVPV